MPFTIIKETKGQRYFKLKKTLHVTKDGRAVDELDPAGIRVLGSAGGTISEDDAKRYKLDASQIESDVEPYIPPEPAPEPPVPEPVVVEEESKPEKPAKTKKSEE